jgi:hypothetical protein
MTPTPRFATSKVIGQRGVCEPVHIERRKIGCRTWSEQSDQGVPNQPAKIAHQERVSADSRSRSAGGRDRITNSSGASKSLTFDFARTTTSIAYTPASSVAFFTVTYWNFFASATTRETCDRSLSVAFRAQLSWHYSPLIAGVRWYPVCACRLGRTLYGRPWFGHPYREHPGHPERKEI